MCCLAAILAACDQSPSQLGAKICANPPCGPICPNPPCHAPPPPASKQCQLVSPKVTPDLALFVVSLHHSTHFDPPDDDEVAVAARIFHNTWKGNPDDLVILLPAGPMIGGSLKSRTDAFKDDLSAEYDGYSFNYKVTGQPDCNLGALTQAIITGKNWPLVDNGCVTHHYSDTSVLPGGYDTFGEFEVKSSTLPVNFYVLAAQTPGGDVGPGIVSQVTQLVTEGTIVRGSEPTFIAGDFNFPEGKPSEIDTSFGQTLETSTNWLNCNRTCLNQNKIAFDRSKGNGPQKLELVQLNGDTRLQPVGIQEDLLGDPNINMQLGHSAVGVLFQVTSTPLPMQKTCPPN